MSSLPRARDDRRLSLPLTLTRHMSYYSPKDRGAGFAASRHLESPPQTKIVATIGPSSEQMDVLQPLVTTGLRIMRLNFSHATYEEAELRIANLRKCQGRNMRCSRQDNMRAVMLDTQGPEIRTGKLQGDTTGKSTISLKAGGQIILRTDDAAAEDGSTAENLYVNYKDLPATVAVGSKVLLDDGAVSLTVAMVDVEESGTVHCTIDNSGTLRSRAGVNLPGGKLTLPALSDKDKRDVRFGLTHDIDYIAASFIQDAAGVTQIQDFVHQSLIDLGLEDRTPPLIIAKIESTEALNNFEKILAVADGIMVARGDLGVEIPIYDVTIAQKKIVSACNAVGKPVIVATQMLETMANNPRPTRAEVSDVTNAVSDGADCVMLSGETAKGLYPVETVRTMTDIIRSAEAFEVDLSSRSGHGHRHSELELQREKVRDRSPVEAVAMAAVKAAELSEAKAIIVMTHTGDTARVVAKYRPSMSILCFCPNYKVGRQLMIYRGCHPYMGRLDLAFADRPAAAMTEAVNMGFLKANDKYVVVMSEESDVLGKFTTMRIGDVPSAV